jgi:hypothetical protein
MKYYGHVSYDMKLPFVTETVAYDIGTLCEVAHELGVEEQKQILDTFLELDRSTARRSEERALMGVRKAQVKLAAYYLMRDDREKARLVYHDMEHDPPERLSAIRDELERVETKDFWEIIDRGRNFEFMPPKQKKAMRRFFTWFDGAESKHAAQPAPTPPEAAPDTPRVVDTPRTEAVPESTASPPPASSATDAPSDKAASGE